MGTESRQIANGASFSFVNETPPASPEEAIKFFKARLACQTDCVDVRTDLERAREDIVVIDVRSKAAYDARHIRGAIHLPGRQITAETTTCIPKDRTVVVYCWSEGCNGATKAAIRLLELGFRVKEMIGGMDVWVQEGNPVEGHSIHKPFLLE